MKEECIFCKIVKGEVPSEKIYEDLDTFAFLDINPVNSGHALVIPKEHYKNLFDISSEAFSKVMETVRKMSPVIKKAVNADGVNIGISNERAANQAVFHLHIHIIPRFQNDGLKMFPAKKYKENESKEIAEKIKSLL